MYTFQVNTQLLNMMGEIAVDFKFLPERFFDQCRQTPDESAFFFFESKKGAWEEMTWSEYGSQVQMVAGWLRAQGIGRGDKVAIISANRPEWIICDLAILSLGAVSVPIYATSAPADIQYVLEHSQAKLVCVDQLDRIKAIDFKQLIGVIAFDEPVSGRDTLKVSIFPWRGVLASKAPLLPEPIKVNSEDLSTIIYTSGTTGRPKGVMHTHGNFRAAMRVVAPMLEQGKSGEKDRFFSFLPLSHVAERVLVQFGSIYTGTEVAFARSVANLAEDLVRCRPTILLCVPRLWEKMYEKISATISRAPLHKRILFNTALKLGSVRIEGNSAYRSRDCKIAAVFSDLLVGKALRKKLGLDKARVLLTGSAPTRPEVMRFFASFGLFIREVYGLTENLCLGVLNDNDRVVIGSCGKAFKENEVKLAPDQEIMFRAPWIFKGYYKDVDATKHVLTEDGWFATGDLGSIDDENYLRIIGRKKELLKTSTGKYVAPVPIEDKLKALTPIADAMVVGDNEKYCIALISLEEQQSCNDTSLHRQILEHLNSINRNLANHESIKRIGILNQGFSVEDGTLTPTLKLKRSVAGEKYASFIAQVYGASEMVVCQSNYMASAQNVR